MRVCIHPAYLSSRLPGFGVRASSSHYPSAVAKSAATEFDVVVCGGGAAGLTAAYFAADAGARVLVLEKESQPGKKILISGGTRCNVLPGSVDIANDYVTESSASALRAVFSSWELEDARQWLSDPEQVGIPLSLEASTNKLFPTSNSAQEVRDKLLAACQRRGVQVQYGADLSRLTQGRPAEGDHSPDASTSAATGPAGAGGSVSWECGLRAGGSVAARRVVLATGGKSFPKLGTDGAGYGILQGLGHTLHAPYAALTPLLGSHPGGQQLAGISPQDVALSARLLRGKGGGGGSRRGAATRAARTAMLFTHRGYSGPAVLDLSHHVTRAAARGLAKPDLEVQWLADAGLDVWDARLKEKGILSSLLRRHGLPQRLADALCEEAGVPRDRSLAELRKQERTRILEVLLAYVLPITGSEGYAKAEVTGGGVPLNELDCSTMESRLAPGVHVCGELADVFGRIGGFNFYFAWVSGRLAGRGAARGLV